MWDKLDIYNLRQSADHLWVLLRSIGRGQVGHGHLGISDERMYEGLILD